MIGSLDELRQSVRNGEGIRGDDAINCEQVRQLAPDADVVTDISIAQAQLMTLAWLVEKRLREQGIEGNEFERIALPMRQAMTEAMGPTLIGDNDGNMVQARTVDEWNTGLKIAWDAIDVAGEAIPNE